MYTRKQKLDGECTHRQYYAQFVNESSRATVMNHIGIKRLLSSKDPVLCDIPLSLWDSLPIYSVSEAMRQHGDTLSLAGKVCIMKETARQIIEEIDPSHPVVKTGESK